MLDLFIKLLDLNIAAVWLILAVMALRLLLKRAPKWITCILWGLVALRLVCPVVPESRVSLVPAGLADYNVAARWSDEYINEARFLHEGSEDFDAAVAAGRTPVWDGEGHFYVVTGSDGVSAPRTLAATYLPVLRTLWLIGMAGLLGWALLSWVLLRRRVREAVPLGEGVWACDAVTTPFVLGLFRPRIYLPSGMTEAQAGPVLAHERAHLRRGDHWWKALGYLLLAVYCFSPPVWAAYLLFCRDLELACDEAAVRGLDIAEKKAYSDALLSCAAPRRMVLACPPAFGEGNVRGRIKNVLNYRKPAFWLVLAALLACAGVAACFLTSPLPLGDELRFVRRDSSSRYIAVDFEMRLGTAVGSGEVWAEQWQNGECVRSAAVPFTRYAGELHFLLSPIRQEDGSFSDLQIQMNTDQYGGSVLTSFAIPAGTNGWSVNSYEDGERIAVHPGDEKILTAMVFDLGGGIRAFDCETLEKEPERLRAAACTVVIRARFSAEMTEAQGETTAPKQVLRLEDILTLSEKGEELTWADFEGFDYTEAGSGLYIRVYETDGDYTLMIGGGLPSDPPRYIYLARTGAFEDHIDIRYEDVSAFLEAHKDDPASTGEE